VSVDASAAIEAYDAELVARLRSLLGDDLAAVYTTGSTALRDTDIATDNCLSAIRDGIDSQQVERLHRPVLHRPRQAPVERDERRAPEQSATLAVGLRRAGLAPAQVAQDREAQVVLRPPAQRPLGLRQRLHTVTGSRLTRCCASPFCAAIAIGSKRAPIGGE